MINTRDHYWWTPACVLLLALICGCGQGGAVQNKPQTIAPSARLDVSPIAGTVQTLFTFNAAGSSDNRDSLSQLTFRWDFDGDGLYDTPYTSESAIQHQYSVPGQYHPTVAVKDTDGNVNTTAKDISVTVLLSLNPLSVTTSVGKTIRFSSSVSGTDNQRIIWSTDGGTIHDGSYLAPQLSGVYHVTATSEAYPSVSLTTEVVVESSNLVVTVQ